MSLTELKPGAPEIPTGFFARARRFFDAAVRYGVSGYGRETRRRLSICNIAGYLATLSSLSFAINFALRDAAGLKWLIAGNLLSAALTATAPLLHRFNAVACPILLSCVVGITLFFFVGELGRDSGIGLNYLGCVAIAFAMFGLGHIRMVFAVVAACIAGQLATHFLFPVGRVQHLVDEGFIAMIYVQSATSIILLLALVVWYAFSIAADAEARTEMLLKNVLPGPIAERLREEECKVIADKFDEATVMFADICGFTALARTMPAEALVDLLNTIFSEFDRICREAGVEKIKTIGDAYMAVSGVPEANDTHAADIMGVALGFQRALGEIAEEEGRNVVEVMLDLAARSNLALQLRSPQISSTWSATYGPCVSSFLLAMIWRSIVGQP